ncbi:site-specific DNA-methyltransferase [Pseudovibrio exalbescens]|uniref:site-specific DNA-methyltransferase n=1 Tax=Pseudovibrio exalbescens TaxID=197461 RepID=UPI0023652FAF|nr:site-specific DNA-methyltransferase [Pseudovibrio exalbescens]MDD7909959.1 site-specific DNA-methyltransferase [Pseudovibrio exalbescens]
MDLNVQQIELEQLVPYARNARTHSDSQVAQIAGSIAEFGFVNPVLVGGDNIIIAGHGRVMAAKKLGLQTVPTIKLDHLTENQRRALVIADNKIAENAGWDEELLRLELQNLADEDFDLDLLGFDDVELDDLLASLDDDEAAALDENIPEVQENPVSRTGDIWIMGEHRLLCGDSTSEADMKKLMGGELADMVFTDPPYNVNYGDTAKDKLRSKGGAKAGRKIMNDNLGDDFEAFLTAACKNMLDYTKGALYICMSSSELDTLQSAFRHAGGKWSTFIIWAKNTFTLGRSDYQRQYEPILYGWKDGNDRYWCGARDQGDVWFYNKPQKNDLHPTMKPVDLVVRGIKNSSKTLDIVLDPFGGSGSTLIAAEHTGRQARLIELDPKYVDVIVRRWQEMTGLQATLSGTGQDFKAVEKDRLGSKAEASLPVEGE